MVFLKIPNVPLGMVFTETVTNTDLADKSNTTRHYGYGYHAPGIN